MKLMFTIHSLSKMGGAEKILVMLANYFVSIKYKVTIVIMSKEEVYFDLDDRIVLMKYQGTKYNNRFIAKFDLIYGQIVYIKMAIDSQKPDIVISFMAAMNILSIIAARLAKTPIIITEHSSFHRGVKNRFWKFLRRITYPFANTLMVLTEQDREKYHFAKQVVVMPNPLVLEAKHHNIEREHIILGVGRLHDIKGFDMLIKAFAKLNEDGWKLLIAGEGDKRNELEALIHEQGLSKKVVLPGLIENMELYYKRASIFVLSSRSEGFPGALCEAMGYGCACVAFNCPTGPSEIITDGIDGVLVEAENIEQLSIALQTLVDNPTDRESLGKHSIEISDKLNIKTIVKRWIEVIGPIVKNS